MLWVALWGGETGDFDDCVAELAGRFGWEQDPADGFAEFLDKTARVVEECGLPWSRLRVMAVEALEICRGGAAVEIEDYDGRSWEQALHDTQYDLDGRCWACVLTIPDSARDHGELAVWVLKGRITWEQIETWWYTKLAASGENAAGR